MSMSVISHHFSDSGNHIVITMKCHQNNINDSKIMKVCHLISNWQYILSSNSPWDSQVMSLSVISHQTQEIILSLQFSIPHYSIDKGLWILAMTFNILILELIPNLWQEVNIWNASQNILTFPLLCLIVLWTTFLLLLLKRKLWKTIKELHTWGLSFKWRKTWLLFQTYLQNIFHPWNCEFFHSLGVPHIAEYSFHCWWWDASLCLACN